jgi:DNA invertase Pin-like site-specific DNA recombinase
MPHPLPAKSLERKTCVNMYDDGGLSGGTMERPALKRLLEDIKTGKVRSSRLHGALAR